VNKRVIKELTKGINFLFYLGIILFLIGILYAIILIFFNQWQMTPIDFISMGMSFIGFAIAFVALTIALKTDDAVKSLTYLNFDEKRAIIAAYINSLTPEHYHDRDFKNNLLRFESDILAVSRLQENILDEDKQMLIQFVNPHIELLRTNLENFEDGEVKTAVENIVQIKDRIVVNLSISEHTNCRVPVIVS